MHYLGLKEYPKLLVLSRNIFKQAILWYSHHIRETQPRLSVNRAISNLPTAVAFCIKYKINYIDLGSCHFFPDEMIHLENMKNLVKFSSSSASATDQSVITQLANRTELKRLIIFGGAYSASDCSKLAKLVHLELMSIQRCSSISDTSLYEYCNMTKLRLLNLSECNITDQGIPALAAFSSLQVLCLAGVDITDACFTTLIKITTLTELDLSSNDNLTDAGVSTLSNLPLLEKLTLFSCNKITGLFLLDFKDSESLRKVELFGCRNLNSSMLSTFPINTRAFQRIFTWSFRYTLENPYKYF